MVIKDLQPFSIVEDKGFTELIHFLDPRYNMPNRKTLKALVKKTYDEKKQVMQKELDEASNVYITTDIWTSINTESFLSITCHFLHNNDEMRTYILHTDKVEGKHTGVTIAEHLKKVFNDCKIENKVRAVVTDNAANMAAAVRMLPLVSGVRCFAHTLNLIVKNALCAIPEIDDVRKKSRKIIKYFKASHVATEKLTEIQDILNLPHHKLIIEVDTRWNSTYVMFERLLEQKQSVIAALSFCTITM